MIYQPLLTCCGRTDVNDTLAVGISPLHFAAYSGNLDALSLLLEAGAALNEKTHEGWSPLMIAAQEGHLGIGCLPIAAKICAM